MYSLSAATEPRREIRLERAVAVFEGEVDKQGFRLTRISTSRNSFRPELTGRIEPMHPSGTRILIRGAPHPWVSTVALVFLTLALGATTLIQDSISWILVAYAALLPAVLYAFEATLTMRAFRAVISRAEQMWADNATAVEPFRLPLSR